MLVNQIQRHEAWTWHIIIPVMGYWVDSGQYRGQPEAVTYTVYPLLEARQWTFTDET